MQSHRAFDVRVFLRGTQVLLPLPLPHGLQVVGVKRGDPPACWHLLHPDTPPEVRREIKKECSFPHTSPERNWFSVVMIFVSASPLQD